MHRALIVLLLTCFACSSVQDTTAEAELGTTVSVLCSQPRWTHDVTVSLPVDASPDVVDAFAAALESWQVSFPYKLVLVVNDATADVQVTLDADLEPQGRTYKWADGCSLQRAEILIASHTTRKQLIGTVAHEVGHMLGLAHSDDDLSLMNERPYSNVKGPTQTDLDNLKALYK